MNWNSWSDFWAMGGYGLYVWGSYAVTIAFMVAELVLLILGKRSMVQHLNRIVRNRSQTPR